MSISIMKVATQFLSLAIFSFAFSMPLLSLEDNAGKQQPRLSITMLLISETVACRPTDDGGCFQWEYRDIEKLRTQGEIISIQQNIPPSEISLGDNLFRAIDQYNRSSPKRYRWERKVIMTIFDFGEPQGTIVNPLPMQLVRKSRALIPGKICIPNRNCQPHKLTGNRVWIDYERADSFLPGNNIEWTLTLGKHSWTYRTLR